MKYLKVSHLISLEVHVLNFYHISSFFFSLYATVYEERVKAVQTREPVPALEPNEPSTSTPGQSTATSRGGVTCTPGHRVMTMGLTDVSDI